MSLNKWICIFIFIVPLFVACNEATNQEISQLETRVAELEAQSEIMSGKVEETGQSVQAAKTRADDAFNLATIMVGRQESVMTLEPAPEPAPPEDTDDVSSSENPSDLNTIDKTELNQALHEVLTTTVNLEVAYKNVADVRADRLLYYIIDEVRVEPEYNSSIPTDTLKVVFAHIESTSPEKEKSLLFSQAAAPDLSEGLSNAHWQLYLTMGDFPLVIQEGEVITFTNNEMIETTGTFASFADFNTAILPRLEQDEITVKSLLLVDERNGKLEYILVLFKNQGSGVPGDTTAEKCRFCQSTLYSWTYECQLLINTCKLYGYR